MIKQLMTGLHAPAYISAAKHNIHTLPAVASFLSVQMVQRCLPNYQKTVYRALTMCCKLMTLIAGCASCGLGKGQA
jgi:hypothetical protein